MSNDETAPMPHATSTYQMTREDRITHNLAHLRQSLRNARWFAHALHNIGYLAPESTVSELLMMLHETAAYVEDLGGAGGSLLHGRCGQKPPGMVTSVRKVPEVAKAAKATS